MFSSSLRSLAQSCVVLQGTRRKGGEFREQGLGDGALHDMLKRRVRAWPGSYLRRHGHRHSAIRRRRCCIATHCRSIAATLANNGTVVAQNANAAVYTRDAE